MVCNRPSSAAELERRAVRAYRLARPARRGRRQPRQPVHRRRRAVRAGDVGGGPRGHVQQAASGYFAYFSDPANAVRTAWSFAAEVGREIIAVHRVAAARGDRPRVKRGGLYPLLRAFATVVERDVAVAAVVGDMLAGRTAVYADLVAYDEVAHHSGAAQPRRPQGADPAGPLGAADRGRGQLRAAAVPDRAAVRPRAERRARPSRGAYGMALRGTGAGRLRAARRTAGARPAARTAGGAEARTAARTALRRPERGRRRGGGRVRGAADRAGRAGIGESRPGRRSPTSTGRATLEEMRAALPRSARDAHRASGDRLRAGPQRAARAAGAGPRRCASTNWPPAADAGRTRWHRSGEGAAAAVLRADGFPHTADLMVNSACDPRPAPVYAFEEQAGSHGGLGGPQSQAFPAAPGRYSRCRRGR